MNVKEEINSEPMSAGMEAAANAVKEFAAMSSSSFHSSDTQSPPFHFVQSIRPSDSMEQAVSRSIQSRAIEQNETVERDRIQTESLILINKKLGEISKNGFWQFVFTFAVVFLTLFFTIILCFKKP